MPTKNHRNQLTARLLRSYQDVTIRNARELLHEAKLLLENNFYARAYMLSVAVIEEVGKSVQIFDALGRDMLDPAVSTRVRLNFEIYKKKMSAAIFPLLLFVPNRKEDVVPLIERLVETKSVRDPALYTDVDLESRSVVTPNSITTATMARTYLDLAREIFDHALNYVVNYPPKIRSKAEDIVFAMKPTVFLTMTESPDFWEYYISRMRAGDASFEDAVMDYNQKYYAKDSKFNPSPKPRKKDD